MAEDLSIKVKVEPDGGGVQGKLNEIAKKNKLKVKAELANESELADKIKNLTSNITAHLEIDPADITKITNQLKNIQSSVGGNVQLFDMSGALKQLDAVETKVTSIVSKLSNVRATISTASTAGVKGSTKNPYAGIAKTLDSQLRKAKYDANDLTKKNGYNFGDIANITDKDFERLLKVSDVYNGIEKNVITLRTALNAATAAQTIFVQKLDDSSLQIAEKAMRKLKEEIADFTKTASSIDKVSESYSGIYAKFRDLQDKYYQDFGNGKISLLNNEKFSSVQKALISLDSARIDLKDNFSDYNLKKYEAALKAASEVLSQFKFALNSADQESTQAFKALPQKITQINNYAKTLSGPTVPTSNRR